MRGRDKKPDDIGKKQICIEESQEIHISLLAVSEDICLNMDESSQRQFSEVARTTWCPDPTLNV